MVFKLFTLKDSFLHKVVCWGISEVLPPSRSLKLQWDSWNENLCFHGVLQHSPHRPTSYSGESIERLSALVHLYAKYNCGNNIGKCAEAMIQSSAGSPKHRKLHVSSTFFSIGQWSNRTFPDREEKWGNVSFRTGVPTLQGKCLGRPPWLRKWNLCDLQGNFALPRDFRISPPRNSTFTHTTPSIITLFIFILIFKKLLSKFKHWV